MDEALKLAGKLDRFFVTGRGDRDMLDRIAALLRSQAAEIERLRAEARADAKLLWGVAHNVKGKRGRIRWAAVRDAVGCGSSVAAELCRRFGVDPDEERGSTGWRRPLPAPPQDSPEAGR
jgi:hypothetical protein